MKLFWVKIPVFLHCKFWGQTVGNRLLDISTGGLKTKLHCAYAGDTAKLFTKSNYQYNSSQM